MPRALFIGGCHDGKIIDVPENSARHNMPHILAPGVDLVADGLPCDGWETYHRRQFLDDDGGTVLVYVHGRVNAASLARRAMEFAEVPPFLLKG